MIYSQVELAVSVIRDKKIYKNYKKSHKYMKKLTFCQEY